MDRDLKFCFLVIGLSAVAFAVGGLVLLYREYVRQQEGIRNWQEVRASYMANLSRTVLSSLKDTKERSARIGVLHDLMTNQEDRVRGAFLWKRDKGVLWDFGLSDGVRAAFPTNARWRSVGSKSLSAPRGWMPITNVADTAIVWARPNSGEVAGLEIDLRDNLTGSNPRNLLVTGVCIAALLLCILAAGGGLLVRAARKARTESARKTTFIDNLSHELKVPLAVVRMKAERLLAGKVADPEKLKAAYQTIADENGAVIRQVDDLLELVRTGKGTRRYARNEFNLNDTVRDAAAALRDRFPPDGLAVTCANGSAQVNADEDAVRQIVRNLLDNAAKYAAAKGRVDVAVSCAGGLARVTVADRGDGIPLGQQEQIFERFFRIDNDLTRTTGGTGIGLSLARCFARDMGGDVTVATRPGGGSIFTLELPEDTHG